MYRLARPLLFLLDAERSHDWTMAMLRIAGNSGLMQGVLPQLQRSPVTVMGIEFPNRVGLAAGLDKNAVAIRGMQGLGFGFVEVGTVTPLPQPGNARPRLFRLPDERAIINRMGFNNEGIDALLDRVSEYRLREDKVPLGINIGKNKRTPAERANDDYCSALRSAHRNSDYITVNLSSPNTPGLRDLQFGEQLDGLLLALREERDRLADEEGERKPVVVKVAPDMARDDALSVVDRLVASGIDGIIATNTTIGRSKVSAHSLAGEAGGLSGAPLREQSTEMVALLAGHLRGQIALVAVGGICHEDDAVEKLRVGADLVQLYSGLIFEGPSLVRRCVQRLAKDFP